MIDGSRAVYKMGVDKNGRAYLADQGQPLLLEDSESSVVSGHVEEEDSPAAANDQTPAANVDRLIQDMATHSTEPSDATHTQQDIDTAKYWQVSPNTQST